MLHLVFIIKTKQAVAVVWFRLLLNRLYLEITSHGWLLFHCLPFLFLLQSFIIVSFSLAFLLNFDLFCFVPYSRWSFSNEEKKRFSIPQTKWAANIKQTNKKKQKKNKINLCVCKMNERFPTQTLSFYINCINFSIWNWI